LTIFSELLQGLFQGTGVKIQSLCPGFTYSEFHDQPKITKYGMKREHFPKEAWMEAEEVVKLSLEAVKSGNVMFIPSEYDIKNAKNARKLKVDDYLDLKILY
jgi:short-subunit dehydrogenase